MKASDQAVFQAKIDALFREFAEDTSTVTYRVLDKETLKLIVHLLAAQRGLNITDPKVRQELEKFAISEMAKFDPERPALAHSAKILRLLAGDQKGSGAKYLENLEIHRSELESEKQSKRAKAERQMNNLDVLILEILESNNDLTTQELHETLRDRKCEWPLGQVDDEYIEVFKSRDESAYKTYAVGGLGTRLSRLRKGLTPAK
jgi:hypothetical protein